jgi:hypothetical protein
MTLILDRLTTEYVSTTVTSPDNPTARVVEFAFVADNTRPTAPDWIAGSWVGVNSPYVAKVLIDQLDPGRYDVWIRVVGNPEIPVAQFDTLIVK